MFHEEYLKNSDDFAIEEIEKRKRAIKIPQSLIWLSGFFTFYIVGGYLRNQLLYGDTKNTDIDIGGKYTHDELCEILKDKEVKVIPVNPNIGTSLIVTKEKESYEYTTFRKDSYPIGGKHSPDKVQFVKTVEEDAFRRDFTVNALYFEPKTGEWLDPTGGIADATRRVLRTVKDPKAVLSEDGLRILRLVRIAATHGLAIDDDTYLAAKQSNYLLKDISKERIRQELDGILLSDKLGNKKGVLYAMELLKELELWQYILPEMTATIGFRQNVTRHAYDVYTHCAVAAAKAPVRLRLAALLHDIGKPPSKAQDCNMYRHAEFGETIVRRGLGAKGLKYPNAVVSRFSRIIGLHMYNSHNKESIEAVRLFISKNLDIIDDLIEFKRIDNASRGLDRGRSVSADVLTKAYRQLKENKVPLTLKDLSIDGKDVAELGVESRKRGIILNKVLEEGVMKCRAFSREEQLALVMAYKEVV